MLAFNSLATQSVMWLAILLATNLVMLISSTGGFAFAAEGGAVTSKRTLWQNTRLLGSPEPPVPYTVEKTFSRIEWKLPIYIAPEPGTDKLWVVLQGGEKGRPSRIVRIRDQDDVQET